MTEEMTERDRLSARVEELEHRVSEYERDKAEQNRITARTLQTERLAAIGQLAAGVAHEINNPASFVMANLDQLGRYAGRLLELVRQTRELLEAQGGAELLANFGALAQKNDVEYIVADMEPMISETLEGMVRIRNIVANLGRFASWGAEDVEEVDLNQMVDSVLALAQSELRVRGRLERQTGPVPPVRAVQGRLANAVLNVVINAAHALDPARAAKNVVTVATGVDGGRIFIRVADTGAGIPAEVLPKIFDPFFTTKKAGVGSGLGLAISQDVLRKLGGEITAESREGQGTVVTIWLPLETPAAGPGERQPRVLVVDDEVPVLKAMNRILGDAFAVSLASSGEEALARLAEDQDFDLILCDLVMPGLDGHQFYHQAIRQWPELEPRFLFFTGGAYPPSLKGFYQAMKERTIPKPLDPQRIIARINALLAAGK
jgi:signal transduction histidine kinase